MLYSRRCPSPRIGQLIKRLTLLFCLFALLLPQPVAAQLAPQRQWVVFRQADGLLSNDVFSILVHDNAIWFGSSLGVNRFDGRWESFPISLIVDQPRQQGSGATPGAVTSMAAAAGGDDIWIATDRGYVARWDGERWQFAASLGIVIDQIVDNNGALWIATHHGLRILEDGQLRAVPELEEQAVHDLVVNGSTVWLATDDGLWRSDLSASEVERVDMAVIDAAALDARNVVDLKDADSRMAQPWVGAINALWSDGEGSLWLGSGPIVLQYDLRLGLGRFFRPFEESHGAPAILDITGTPGERVLIASAGAGVAQYLLDDGLLAAANNLGSSADGGLDTNIVRSLAIDQDDTLWFASPVGVFRYQQWAWQEIDARLDGLVINDVLYDRSGALWIATGGEGIQRRQGLYANPDFYFPSDDGLPSEFVNDLEEDTQGTLWAATAEGLAVHRGLSWAQSKATALLPSRAVQCLQADEQGVWIGTSAGLAYYDAGADTVRLEPFFAGESIVRMARDGAGALWVVTGDGDIWLSDAAEGGWRNARQMGLNAPAAGAATALVPEPGAGGGMYVAFLDAGIFRWTGEGWANVDSQRWPKADTVGAMALDPVDGSLWVGSEIGLSRLDRLSLTTYDSHDGMQNGAIRVIAAGPGGSYWFGGQKGLTLYAGERTPPWIAVKSITSPGITTDEERWNIFAGRAVEINYVVGDMQSPPDKLTVFYRLHRPGVTVPWREATDSPLSLQVESPDTLDLELIVRDQAFNYSQAISEHLIVAAPPPTVNLPLVGEVGRKVFQLLLTFGTLALCGFGYVSYEILHRQRRVMDAVSRGFNPYISGEPVRREEMFFGRHGLLDRIVATLHNNSIMIHGERRIGKTTLLYQLANALRQVQDNEYWFVPVLIDLEGTAEQQLFLQLGEDIYQEVVCMPGLSPAAVQSLHQLLCHQAFDIASAGGAPTYTDREFGRDLRTIIRVLEQYCHEHQIGRQLRLILLLDEVDTLSHFNHIYQQQLRRIFMRDFAATLGAVVAGIAISKEWDRVESPWYNLFNEIAMQPFSRSEAIELLVEPVRGYYLFEPAAISFVIDQSEGRPYRIQQYAMEAVNNMLKYKRRRILMVDVEFAHTQILATMVNLESVSQPLVTDAAQTRQLWPAAVTYLQKQAGATPADQERRINVQALRQWIGGSM